MVILPVAEKAPSWCVSPLMYKLLLAVILVANKSPTVVILPVPDSLLRKKYHH